MSKIYVVKFESGEYDSYQIEVSGIFTEKELAEDLKNKINNKIKEIDDIKRPHKKTSYNTMTAKESKALSIWTIQRYTIYGANVFIEEYLLNEEILPTALFGYAPKKELEK